MRDSDLVVFILFFLTVYVDANCLRTFNCSGNLLEFPLSDKAGCGLLTVNCNDDPYPTVQLEAGGQWYVFFHKTAYYDNTSKTYAIEIFDHQLEDLKRRRDCYGFRNISLPKTQSWASSVEIIASDTTDFVSCKQSLNPNSTSVCEHYLYRRDAYSDIPESCVVLSLPSLPAPNPDDLLQMVNPEYTVKWTFSDDCAECLDRGRMCAVDNEGGTTCLEYEEYEEKRSKSSIAKIVAPVVCGCAILLGLFAFLIYRHKKTSDIEGGVATKEAVELFLRNNGTHIPKRYKYSSLKKITYSFSEKLGKGGYGNVYMGTLCDGRLVAVKVLSESNGDGEEFINEVASISRTSHVNIVTLLGFCIDGSKRALIYEFMPNGSLEKFVQNPTTECFLGWEKLLNVAIEIARGLEYLHLGCNMRILHFDIKPHNILLDKDMNPKISDFGLARLCPNRSSVVSMLVPRGTIGYIAPEIFSRMFGEVSHKSDVYSYGMMIIEMVLGRQNPDILADSSEAYFPDWIYKHLEVNNSFSLCAVTNEDDSKIARKIVIVGLWCIQTEPKARPSISKVVEMLIGSLDALEIPSKPQLCLPFAQVHDDATLTDRTDTL